MRTCRAILGLVCLATIPAFSVADELTEGFLHPPDTARPWVYWFIMDGNLSREGITADFEAMRDAGIGGVILMEVNVGIPRGPVEFMSEEWRALFKHAVEEAERLGLEITLNAGPGWTGSGGPWVKAEQSMQHLVASAVDVSGPVRLDQVLSIPEPLPPYFGAQGLPQWLTEARAAFYADEAVLAFPRVDDTRIEDIDEKALYVREPYTSKPGVPQFLPASASYPSTAPDAAISRESIVDLTRRLQPDGRLIWDVPKGNWTILRFGRRNTGANTRPAPEPGLGFESDKFDPAALDAHFDAFVGSLLRTIGPRPLRRTSGWTMLHIDSWEMGSQNWTAGFADTFQQRRGYDPRPYLPAMTGRIVESIEVSECFLWDLRLTAQELVIENHAEHLKELGRRHGFGLSIEPYDMNPTADMTLGGVADVPMCEFWSHGFGFDSNFSCVEAASIAHTLGRPIVAAEAFTADAPEAWQLYPAAMKNQGDWALCAGINRFVFHRYAHQPWLDRRPGMTMGPYGVHWDRTQTWWPMIAEYHRYVARCQFLLRQGAPVADVLYLVPEGAPHVFRPPSSAFEGVLPDRRGYNFDGCAPETLRDHARVENGMIAFPGGATYRLLVLPAFETMTPGLLGTVKSLVEAGATVVGRPPRKSPSLSNYPQCDREVESIATELWGGVDPPPTVERRSVGQGTVIWGGDLTTALSTGPVASSIAHARWIWHGDSDPAASAAVAERFFRRVFTLDADRSVRAARVDFTVDNRCTLWVNGIQAGQSDGFNTVFRVDVTRLLKPGANVLAVRARNYGDAPNPAGVIAALEGEYEDGATFEVNTDDAWEAASEAPKNWRTLESPIEGWVAATDLGPSDMAPWKVEATIAVSPVLYPAYQATANILKEMGTPPDFESDGLVRYTHRRAGDTDIYFVANRADRQVDATCTFHVEGGQPQLWDPVTAERRTLPEVTRSAACTTVPLRFETHQSYFVIFGKDVQAIETSPQSASNFPEVEVVTPVSGPWQVRFDTTAGGPEEVQFDTLTDWTERDEDGIKYYSGIATYRTTFDFPEGLRENLEAVLLDLGEVHVMARVRLNGIDLGVVWCAPWRVGITTAVRDTGNELEIDVANLWPNRLIGDSALPEDQRLSWTTWSPYKPDSPLLPSGLLGPVQIMVRE